MGAQEPKAEWYAAINPNGRMPAIVHVKDDDSSVTVFESAACLLYLASTFDKQHKFSYPIETPEYWTQLSWVGILYCRVPLPPFQSYSEPSAH